MNFAYNRDCLLVVGKSGSGKTQNIIAPILAKVPPNKVWLCDSNYEFRDFPNKIRPAQYTPQWLDQFIREFRKTHYDCLLVIEDLDLFSPNRSEELIRLAINSRHQNIGLVLVSRRILGLPKQVVVKATWICLFRGLSVEDRDYLLNINSDWESLQLPTEDYKFLVLENR